MKQVAAILLLGLTLSQSAHAKPADASSAIKEAAQHYARGFELVKKEDFAGAATEFERAYSASPNYSVLYNLGHAYSMTGRPIEAVATFRRFLLEGGAKVAPDLEASALATIAADERRFGRVHVKLYPDSAAEVMIDGQAVSVSASAQELPLMPGTHGLWLTESGYRDTHRSFEVKASEVTVLEIALEPLPVAPKLVAPRADVAPAPPPFRAVPPRAKQTAPHSSARTWSYVLGGSGVGLGVVAGVVYALNGAAYSRWEARRDRLSVAVQNGGGASQRAELGGVLSELSRRQRVDDLSLGLGVSAGVCLAASGYLLWNSYDGEGQGQVSQLGISSNGMTWSGTW